MEELNNFIGKTVVKIEESEKLDQGVKITFNDGSTLECAWNNWEGCFYTTQRATACRSAGLKNENLIL